MLSKFTRHHAVVFCLTFMSFAQYHATRKVFSNSKNSLSSQWTPTSCNSTWPCPYPFEVWNSRHLFTSYEKAEPFLGILDTVFLFAYAVGLFISGIIAERFELRIVLAVGMWLTSVVVFVFGTLTELISFYNKPFYVILWILNGLVQSTGWPCCVAIVGNWFGENGRGLIFGVWSSCASVGNIFGSIIASALMKYGYEMTFLYGSVSMFCMGIVAFCGIISSPVDIGLEDPNALPCEPEADDVSDTRDSQSTLNNEYSPLVRDKEPEAIGFNKAIRLPGVIRYSLTYAAIKLINYSFIFWLPYYLTNRYGWADSTAGYMSTWYDVGSVIGGIIFGAISDYFGKRSPTLFGMATAAPFAILGYNKSPNNLVVNGVLLGVVGIFIGGISNILGTAVTADIGKQAAVGRNTAALATVTGIIDGTGSIGAALGQYIVTLIHSYAGWNWVMYSFMIEVGLVLLTLLPSFIEDVKSSSFAEKIQRSLSDFRASHHENNEELDSTK